MAEAKSTATKGKARSDQDELDSMFAEPEELDGSDLLDDIDDDESEAWMPTEKGEGIYGEVVRVGQTKSDYALPGQDPMVPVITVKVKDGDDHQLLRVTGYAFLLRKGIDEANPAVGDTMAFKFLGKGTTKKGQPINKYGVAIRKAPAPAAAS